MTLNRGALAYQEGVCGAGGVQPIGYYGFIEDVETFPVPPTVEAAADYAALATIATPIVMKAGKTMYAMAGELETAGLDGESIGERGSMSKSIKATWYLPSTEPANLGASKYFNNRRMFFIVKEQNGQYRVVGSNRFPASVKSKDTTGMKVADRRGVTLEIETYDCGPAPVYTAAIPVDSAQDLGV
jgi:hypothetical protein